MIAETTNPPARFSYSSRWTIVPRVIALSTLGGVILLGAVWSAFIGKASGGTLLLIVLGV